MAADDEFEAAKARLRAWAENDTTQSRGSRLAHDMLLVLGRLEPPAESIPVDDLDAPVAEGERRGLLMWKCHLRATGQTFRGGLNWNLLTEDERAEWVRMAQAYDEITELQRDGTL